MYINLNKLVFMITDACPGKCLHCQIGTDGTKKTGKLNAERAEAALMELAAKHTIHSVLMFGGEPMLYPESVYRLVSAATRLGIEGRGMISNGMVNGKSDTAAAYAAGRELKYAGIVNVLVSVDAFHEKHIPIETAYAFASGLKDAGVNVRLHPAWVRAAQDDNHYNIRTREILKMFDDLEIESSHGNVIIPMGSAKHNFTQYYFPLSIDELKAFRCGDIPYTDKLDDVGEVHINPDGSVAICGFEIGDINKNNLADIVERYNPYENEYLAELMQQGPYSLYTRLRQQGKEFDITNFHTGCELCQKAMEYLK